VVIALRSRTGKLGLWYSIAPVAILLLLLSSGAGCDKSKTVQDHVNRSNGSKSAESQVNEVSTTDDFLINGRSTNTLSHADERMSVDLRRIRLHAKGKLVCLEDVEQMAQEWLQKEGLKTPSGLAPVFEMQDGPWLVTVKYSQGVGNRCWWVRFDRDGEVANWGTRTMREEDAPFYERSR